jgi:hypothetical protein
LTDVFFGAGTRDAQIARGPSLAYTRGMRQLHTSPADRPDTRRVRTVAVCASLAVVLCGMLAGLAAATTPSVHLTTVNGRVTVFGFVPLSQMLNVTFDAKPCAATFKAESLRSTTSWGGNVNQHFVRRFGPKNYASVARYACVYVEAPGPDPMTVAHLSALLN